MEHIFSAQTLPDEISPNVCLFCETKNEHFWQHIDMTRFDKMGTQLIECPCGREQFVIRVRTILEYGKKKQTPF